MSNQNLDALLGPSGRSDYSTGDTISYMDHGERKTGTIIHVEAPGLTPSGKHHPTQYWTDAGTGFPDVVYGYQITERK